MLVTADVDFAETSGANSSGFKLAPFEAASEEGQHRGGPEEQRPQTGGLELGFKDNGKSRVGTRGLEGSSGPQEQRKQGRIQTLAWEDNRVMVVITQTSSVGSWVEAHVDGAQIANLEVNDCDADNLLPSVTRSSEKTYDVQVMFGDRRKDYERVYARRLLEVLHELQPSCTSLLLGIAVKNAAPSTFRKCVESVKSRIISE